MNRIGKQLICLMVIALVFGALYLYLNKGNLHLFSKSADADNDALASAYSRFEDCPQEGDAKSEKAIELNRYKNRFRFPKPDDFDPSITLSKIMEPGDDQDRWSPGKAARITGYICDVKPGGVETCNCKEHEDKDKDTHIEIVIDPMQTGKTQRMVVEVTPRMRDIMEHRGEDWSTRTLRDRLLGRWVEIEGWMLFDDEHIGSAENTAPGRERNWRATAWEIHPVTGFKVVDRPRSL